jgi:hypothetical protein
MKSVAKFKFKPAELGIFKTSEVRPVVDLIEPNHRVMGLTMGNFSLIDLIYGILQKIGGGHVVCATWSAGIKDAHQAKYLMDTNLVRSFTLLTDHSYKTRQNKYAVSIEELFGKENIRTSEMHAKFTLVYNDKVKITVLSSMNLNANKTCETFEIDMDAGVFDFYMDFVNHTFGSMPEGFESSSEKAGKSLEGFFNRTNKTSKLWTEI